MENVQQLETSQHNLGYVQYDGSGIGVLLVAGHTSEMETSFKTNKIKDFCIQNDIPFTTFDYQGYGFSGGTPKEKWIVDTWCQNTIDIIDALIDKPVIIIGNSMGGYIGAALCVMRPHKVHGFIGVAAGFGSYAQKTGRTDFVMDGQRFGVDIVTDQRPNYHVITQNLDIKCPVNLIHGTRDALVPFATAENLADQIGSNADIFPIDGDNHALQTDEALKTIYERIVALRS